MAQNNTSPPKLPKFTLSPALCLVGDRFQLFLQVRPSSAQRKDLEMSELLSAEARRSSAEAQQLRRPALRAAQLLSGAQELLATVDAEARCAERTEGSSVSSVCIKCELQTEGSANMGRANKFVPFCSGSWMFFYLQSALPVVDGAVPSCSFTCGRVVYCGCKSRWY